MIPLDISLVVPSAYLQRVDEIYAIVNDTIDEDCSLAEVEAELRAAGFDVRVTGYAKDGGFVLILKYQPVGMSRRSRQQLGLA
jgi:hypothetical protein